MTTSFINIPGNGAGTWETTVDSAVDLPMINNTIGDIRVTIDTGNLYEWNGTSWQLETGGGGGGGTVTSVSLSTPSYFTVSGSPVVGAGTLTFTGTSEPANQILATPNGTAGALGVRTLVAGDIPPLSYQPIGNYLTALTGDGIANGPGSAVLTLKSVNSNIGSFGNSANVGNFTVNAKGLITAANNSAIQIAESQVTNLVSDLANKLDFIPYSNTAFVNGAGDDSTGVLNRIDLPFLTIAGAMASIVDTSVLNQIIVQTPGTFTIDGLNWLANVFIYGIAPAITLLDLGTSGITFDSSWGIVNQPTGGFVNCTLQGPNNYTFLISSGTTPIFSLDNVTNNSIITFSGSGSPGVPIIELVQTQNSNTFSYLDVSLIGINYVAFGSNADTFTVDSGSTEAILLNCCMFSGLTIEGSTGTAVVYMIGGNIFQSLRVDGSSATFGASGGVIPASASVSITGGATLIRFGDAFGLGYTPGDPTKWNGSPTVLQDAIDRIAAVVGNITPIP